jgi:hypothetical protein
VTGQWIGNISPIQASNFLKESIGFGPPPNISFDFMLSTSSAFENQPSGRINRSSGLPDFESFSVAPALYVNCFFYGVRVRLDDDYFIGDIFANALAESSKPQITG